MEDNSQLIPKIARLYYHDQLTQRDISLKMGISGASVSRLLKQARNSGIVKIIIDEPNQYSFIERELERVWNLREAVVVSGGPDSFAAKVAAGRAASSVVSRLLRDEMMLGIAWGSTLLEVVNALRPTPRKGITIVQLIGGSGGIVSMRPRVSATELVIRASEALNATPVALDAPAIVDTKNGRSTFIQEESIKKTLNLAGKVDVALIGVGEVGSQSLLLRAGILSRRDLRTLIEAHAVGDICCHFFDLAGRTVVSPIEERVIGISLETLKTIQCVVAVVTGRLKAEAVLGALRTGLIHILVTDEALGQELLTFREKGFARPKRRANEQPN